MTNLTLQHGNTELMAYGWAGNLEMVKEVLKKSDPKQTNNFGADAVKLFFRKGNHEILDFLKETDLADLLKPKEKAKKSQPRFNRAMVRKFVKINRLEERRKAKNVNN